jgi:hypothetical protein
MEYCERTGNYYVSDADQHALWLTSPVATRDVLSYRRLVLQGALNQVNQNLATATDPAQQEVLLRTIDSGYSLVARLSIALDW